MLLRVVYCVFLTCAQLRACMDLSVAGRTGNTKATPQAPTKNVVHGISEKTVDVVHTCKQISGPRVGMPRKHEM